MAIVALVGMTGSGKTEVANVFRGHGFEFVRFGQVVLDEVKRRELEINEKNERMVREELRSLHGMDVMAKFLLPVFDRLLPLNHVVADGLYSWEEYKLLKERYGDKLYVLAVYASPATRYARLKDRALDLAKDPKMQFRPFTPEEAHSRDYSEIENVHKAGPIAMADLTIVNEANMKALKQQVEGFIKRLGTKV